jgi:hypothetical protein
MNCDQVRRMLPSSLEGSLSKTENALVEKHLASCGACRAVGEEYRDMWRLCKNLEEVEPPPGFARKVMARLEEEKGPGVFRRLFYPLHIKVPVQAAVAVAVAVLAIQAYRAVEPPTKIAPQAPIAVAPQPREEAGRKEGPLKETAQPAQEIPPISAEKARKSEEAAKDAAPPRLQASAPPEEPRVRPEKGTMPPPAPSGAVATRQAEKAEKESGGKRVKLEAKAAAPAPASEPASHRRIPLIGLTLLSENPPGAGEKIQGLLREIGAGRIEVVRVQGREIVTAELNPERLPLLMNFLRSLGEAREMPRGTETNLPSVLIRIEIFRE